MVAVTLMPVIAAASCPPLGSVPPTTTTLERIVQSFLQGPGPPPSPREVLDVLVRENVPPFGLWPPSGPAPLEVTFRWLAEHEPTTTIEFAADGGTRLLWESGRVAPPTRRHTYERPGLYQATIWIRETTGGVHRFSHPVEVLDATAFHADLQARWSTMKARLRARDVPGALECISARQRKDYRDRLDDVFVRQGKRVDDVLTTISFESMSAGGGAEYKMRRVEGALPFAYYIEFRIDVDRVWRLNFF
jgi:hypothetical protein